MRISILFLLFILLDGLCELIIQSLHLYYWRWLIIIVMMEPIFDQNQQIAFIWFQLDVN